MIASEGPRPVTILLVEDDPADVRLILEALREGHVENRLLVAEDGDEAMAVLRKQGKHAQAPRPDVVLLDLNLPKRNGFKVLEDIKTDPALRDIPVVVLTTSNAERDVAESYRLQANAFVTKPRDLWKFFEVIHTVEGFWTTAVRLPTRRNPVE